MYVDELSWNRTDHRWTGHLDGPKLARLKWGFYGYANLSNADMEKDAEGLLDWEENKRIDTDGDRTCKRRLCRWDWGQQHRRYSLATWCEQTVWKRRWCWHAEREEEREAAPLRGGWRIYARCQGMSIEQGVIYRGLGGSTHPFALLDPPTLVWEN